MIDIEVVVCRYSRAWPDPSRGGWRRPGAGRWGKFQYPANLRIEIGRQVCPAPEEFLNDIHASTISSEVKWCPAMRVRIHRDALIQKCPDAIQVSVPSRVVNGCHLLLCTNRIIPFHQRVDGSHQKT